MCGDPPSSGSGSDALVLHRVTQPSDPWLGPAEALYRESFERRERRENLSEPMPNPHFHLQGVLWHGTLAGFVTFWRFEGFVFIEHLAMRPEMRGSGLGATVVARVARNAPLTVLETERAEEGPTAGRRLAWYRRLGFSENPQAYRQPSYGPGLPDVPMHLLSHPRPLEAREFESVVRILRRDVYAVRGG